MTLTVSGLTARYGNTTVLRDASLRVSAGEVVALIGANGAGKSTMLNSIAGVHRSVAGSVDFDGAPVLGLPAHRIAERGIALVLEGRRLFGALTVQENLRMGLHGLGLARPDGDTRIAEVYALFPILREFAGRRSGLLSGGQQQMLAIGRALVRHPKVLILDEPSLGLAPLLVQQILDTVRALADGGVAVILAEQNASAALRVATTGIVIDNGRVVRTDAAQALLDDDEISAHYLGGRKPEDMTSDDDRHVGELPAALRERALVGPPVRAGSR